MESPAREQGKSFVSFKMAYDQLRKEDGEPNGEPLEMVTLDEERAPEVGADSETENEGGGSREDQVGLISSEDIDEDGVVKEYEVALKYIGFGLFHVLLIACNGIALSSDAVEVLSISFVLPIIRDKDEFDIADWQNAMLSSIIFLGMLFGGYFWGSLSDLSGRRSTLLFSFTVNGLFGFCSALAPNFYVFLFFRFVSGIG